MEGITQMLRICRSCHRPAWLRTSRCFKVHRTFPLRSSPFGFDSLYWSWWRESNPQPADYKSAALPLSHTSEGTVKKLATWNGLEPSTSSVTGWHSNQLNYRTAYFQPSMATDTVDDNGGRYRARTYDILLVRQTLSQLS